MRIVGIPGRAFRRWRPAAALGAQAYDRATAGHASDEDLHDVTLLAGYIQGVVDAGDGTAFCLIRVLDVSQVMVLIRRDLDSHPGAADVPAAVLIDRSLFDAFPCR